MADYTFTTALDTSGMLRDATVAARNLPALRFRVDSKPLGVISGQISEFQRSLSAASARVLSFSATAGQIFAVTRAFQATFKAMVDVEKQLIDINSILGLSKTQLTQFSTQLFKVANETGQSFKVAAEGAVELSRQGLSASETIKRLKDSLTLTRLSGLKAADSVTAITTALNGFNDAALDSTAIINKLSSVDAAFAVSSNDLAQALSRVGSTAKDTGVSFDELMGLVTAAKQITGREGAVIGNSLKTIFTRIQRPDTLNQLKELGVLVENVGGEALSAQQILVNLAKAYDTLSSAQKNQVVQLSAGVFQANQFRAILQDLSKESSIAARATNISATATDQAARRQAELNKTLASSINETINNLTNAAAKIGKLTLEPALKVVLDGKSVIPGLNTLVQSISGDTEQKGQNVGEFFATGLLKGIGNYLSGPGIALGGVLIARLFATFASFTAKSVAQIIEVTGSRYQAEQAITKLLAEQPSLYSRINALGGNQQKIESLINAELLKRNVLLNEQAAAIQAISGLTSARNIPFVTRARPFAVSDENLVRNPRKGAAVGFVPELKEITGALEGGYKPGKVKEIDIPRIGKVVYNTAETVKKFPGFIQPAIIPPQSSKAGINYNKSFINAHGFSPYKSEGLVPNFLDISLLKQFRKGLQAPIKFGYGLGQISGYSNSSGIILNPDTGLTRETLSHETVHQILPQNLKSALKETSIYNSEYFKGTRAFDKIRYRPKHYDINTVAEEFLADIPSLAQTSPKFVASKLQMMGLNEKQIKTILKLSNRIYEKSGQRLQTNLPAYSSGFSPSYNKGLVPNYANPKDSFLNYIREINPSYVTKFRALQKDDTGLAKFLRLTTDQRGAPAMQQMGDLLKKDLLQYTPRQYGLGTTAYANLKENPQQIRAGIGKVFGQFGMDIPNFMPQINRGQLEILLKDSQFAKKLKSFTYTNAKGETKDYNLAQHRVRPDLNVGAPAPAGYKNWTDLDNQTRSLALYVQSPDGKIGKKRFSLDSFKQLRAEGETFDIAAKGLIPSFNALSSAISREKSAGLPLSQIRVGSSPRIQSHLNPLGLGVYNTRDEPGGLQQGINRVAAMGLDPKKAGIPNYANEGLFTSTLEISKTGQLSLLELKSLNDEINKYKNQIRFGQKDQTKINQAIDSLTKAYQLNEAAIQKITLSFTSLYKPILATQQRIGKAGVNRQGLTGQLSGVSGGQLGFDFLTPPAPGQGEFLSIVNQANLQTRQKAVGQTTTQFQALLLSQLVANNKTRTGYLQSNELDRIRNNIGIGGTSNLSRLGFIPNEELTGVQSLRLQKALVESRKKRREEIERKTRIRPDFEEKRRQERISNGLSIGQSSFNYGQTETGFVGKSELVGVQSSRLQELLAKSKIELPQRQALDSFNKTLGGLGLSSVLFNTKAYRNAIAQSKGVGGDASLKEFRQGIANRALTASFVTPLLAGIAEQGATTLFGNESRGARTTSRAVGALGNISSFALTGLGIAGGNPLGAAVGGAIGALTELPSVFKAFSDTLPDLQRRLEQLKETSLQSSSSISQFIDATERLDDISSGRVTGARGSQIAQLRNQQLTGLIGIPSSENRRRLRELVQGGDISGAREFQANIAFVNEQRENSNKLSEVITKFLDGFKTPSQIETGLRGKLAFGRELGFSQQEIEKIVEGGIKQELNKPRRIEEVQKLSSLATSTLFGLQNLGGENLFGIATEKQNIDAINKMVGEGQNLIDVFEELGKAAEIDSESLENTIKILRILSKTSKEFTNEINKSLSPSGLQSEARSRDLIEISRTRREAVGSRFFRNLIESQNIFEKFGQRVNINEIKGLNNLTGSLRGNEIIQNATNQIQLSLKGQNPFVANLLAFQEEQTKVANDLTIHLKKLSGGTKENIFNVISEARKNLSNQLAKEVETTGTKLSPDELKRKTQKLFNLTTAFQDVNILKIQAILDRGDTLDEKDLSQIKDFLEKRVRLFETFQTVPTQITQSLQQQARGQNLGEFIKTPEGKEIATGAGLINTKGELTDAGKLVVTSGKSPQEVSDILSANKAELNASLTLLERFRDILDNFVKSSTQATKESNVTKDLSRIQFEQRNRIIPLNLRFTEERANLIRSENIGAARGDEFGNRGNINLRGAFLSELQYDQNTFWRDMAINTQDFGKDFRESFKSGFREAITGAKDFTEALRGIGINIASSFLTKASDLAVSSLLGGIFNQSGTTGPLAGFLGLKEKGGYIPKLAKGGFVNMGSGIKDDVPAFLSGGEFVLNKRAVSRIGKHNLDRINFSQGVKQPERFLRPEENQFSGAVLSDYSSLSGNSAIIKLANTLEVNKFGRDPRMNVSPLLSSYGLTDENNPQNKLRFAREKWIFERKQFDKQVEDARKKFNDQQVTSLVTSYLTAGVNAYAMRGPSPQPGPYSNINPTNNGAANFNLYRNIGMNTASFNTPYRFGQALGGYIPKFNRGGYFGGDMDGDRLAAMVQGGEYVVGPKTVSNYGTSYFNSLNKMANGGYVGGDYSNTDINDNISKLISVTEQVRDRLSSPTNQNNQQNQQGGGNVFNINISTSLNSDGSVKNTQTDVKSNNNQNQNTVNDKDAMVKLSQTIRTKIIEVINQESRGGGILSEKFVSRR